MTTTAGVLRPEDAHFMELALKHASIAITKGQTPCGAVVLDRDGRLIGEGHNTVRADRDPTAHGEIVAIRAAWQRVGDRPLLAGATLSTRPSSRASSARSSSPSSVSAASCSPRAALTCRPTGHCSGPTSSRPRPG
jgi:Cytidine and deoxycytidylate deaminase zinc-binding region